MTSFETGVYRALAMARIGDPALNLWEDRCGQFMGVIGVICGRPSAKRWLMSTGKPVNRIWLLTGCDIHSDMDEPDPFNSIDFVEISEGDLAVLRVMYS